MIPTCQDASRSLIRVVFPGSRSGNACLSACWLGCGTVCLKFLEERYASYSCGNGLRVRSWGQWFFLRKELMLKSRRDWY